jgi:hypothetical protein
VIFSGKGRSPPKQGRVWALEGKGDLLEGILWDTGRLPTDPPLREGWEIISSGPNKSNLSFVIYIYINTSLGGVLEQEREEAAWATYFDRMVYASITKDK